MLLLETKKAAGAAGEWTTGSLMPNPPFSVEREANFLGDGDLDDSSQSLHEGGPHLLRAEEKAVREAPSERGGSSDTSRG